jgi:hypothetical protein
LFPDHFGERGEKYEWELCTIDPKMLYFGTPVALVISLNEDGTTDLAPNLLFFGRWVGR